MKPITIVSYRFNYFPENFIFQNQVLRVKAVVRTTTSHQAHEFQVQADDGRSYTLVHNLKKDEWKAR